MIIDGRNHYPQDLEYSAQESTKALRTGYVAAFSVPANQLPDEVFENAHAGLKRDPDDTSEQLVIVGERAPGAHKLEMGPIADDIRAAIAVRHGVTVRDVLLTPAGAIPRTSSGKIGRRACRSRLPGRQPAQRQDRQRFPRRDGLTPIDTTDLADTTDDRTRVRPRCRRHRAPTSRPETRRRSDVRSVRRRRPQRPRAPT